MGRHNMGKYFLSYKIIDINCKKNPCIMPTIPKNQNLKIENLIKRNKRIIPFSGLFYLFLKKNLAWLPGWSCPVRHATGMPCPTCFLTRSITASLNGDISDALHFHVLGPPTTIFLVSWAFLSLKSGLFYPFKIRKKFYYLIGITFLIYWIYRLICYYIIGWEVFPM